MTVSISRFFRDRGLWKSLREEILPLLAKAGPRVRVWCAGCASGEEVYSLKILWEGRRRTDAPFPALSILATDLCPEYLERAGVAVYPPSSMKEIPEEIRCDFFERTAEGSYALKPWIREGVQWRVHDLLSDPPGTGFDLTFLRNNLLTYYKDAVKIPALKKVVDSLAPGGFLVVGSHERLPIEPAKLRPWKDSLYIYRKQLQVPLFFGTERTSS